MSISANLFDKAVVDDLPRIKGQERAELIRKFWPDTNLNHTAFDEFSYAAIVKHIKNELDQVRHHRRLFAAQSLEQLLEIVKYLRQNNSKTYNEVVEHFQPLYPTATPNEIRRSIELIVRVWLTINIHSSDIFVGPMTDDVPMDWPLDVSLTKLLQRLFGRRVQLQPHVNTTRCDPAVTLAYLVHTCGMRLRWTEDMACHLKFDINRLELTIYRHKACLLSHIDGPNDCPIPRDVLEEILDTMDLLLPSWDDATKQLLLREGQQSLYTLGCRRASRELDLARYRYFGDRLEYLMESFNKTPRTWKQLALDRRNKLEWSAFWITVMVAILTMVSIPCNIIQATYSIKAYNVAVAQGAGQK